MTSTHATALSGLRKRTRPTRSVPRPPRMAKGNRGVDPVPGNDNVPIPPEKEGHFGGPVGYGNPPKSGQFQKKQTGNPIGRPKGSRNINTLLREEIASELTVIENGKRTQKPSYAAMIMAVKQKGLSGDVRAMKLYFDMLGKYVEPEDTAADAPPLTPAEEQVLRGILKLRGESGEAGGDA